MGEPICGFPDGFFGDQGEKGSPITPFVVHVTSPALIGGPSTVTTNEKGQLRFPALPPGSYALDIEAPGFVNYHDGDISTRGLPSPAASIARASTSAFITMPGPPPAGVSSTVRCLSVA